MFYGPGVALCLMVCMSEGLGDGFSWIPHFFPAIRQYCKVGVIPKQGLTGPCLLILLLMCKEKTHFLQRMIHFMFHLYS